MFQDECVLVHPQNSHNKEKKSTFQQGPAFFWLRHLSDKLFTRNELETGVNMELVFKDAPFANSWQCF